jgi:predicted enzyme related to lactoylglutathione lyase
MGKPIVHLGIGCRDTKKTQEFYAGLFDWKFEPMGPAVMIKGPGRKHHRFVQARNVAASLGHSNSESRRSV